MFGNGAAKRVLQNSAKEPIIIDFFLFSPNFEIYKISLT